MLCKTKTTNTLKYLEPNTVKLPNGLVKNDQLGGEVMEDTESRLYCIIVHREVEEPYILHYRFDYKPTRKEILELVLQEELGYDDDYGKLEYWEVKE